MTAQEREARLKEITHTLWEMDRIPRESRTDELRKTHRVLCNERGRHEAALEWPRHAEQKGLPRVLWCVNQLSDDWREPTPTDAYAAVHRYLYGYGPTERAEDQEPTAESDWDKRQCLILAGPTGTGKSYAAAFAAVEAENMSDEISRFVYFPALCGKFLVAEERAAALELAKETTFMVFDDFGTEYLKEGGLVEAFTDEIIWHREGNRLPTILTTNLTPEQLRQRWSDRIVDRLNGWGKTVVCAGPSLRGA